MSDIAALVARLHRLVPKLNEGWTTLIEAADALEAMQAENERHQKANLVRAVTDPLWSQHEGWIADYIAREDFDAIPWRIAQELVGVGHERDVEQARADRLAAGGDQLAEALRRIRAVIADEAEQWSDPEPPSVRRELLGTGDDDA